MAGRRRAAEGGGGGVGPSGLNKDGRGAAWPFVERDGTRSGWAAEVVVTRTLGHPLALGLDFLDIFLL